MIKRRWLGALAFGVLGALMGACSSEPGTSGSPPAVQTPGARFASGNLPQPTPGAFLMGPDVSTFATCKLVHPDGSSFSADPQFVVQIPDSDGAHYGLNDGYSLPFPTPWIYDPSNPSSQCGKCQFNCGSTSHCAADPDATEYELLWQSKPNVSSTQYLVYTLQNDPNGKGTREYQVGGKQFFFNGTSTYIYAAARNAAVDSSWGQAADVEAVGGNVHYDGYWWGNCVYVLQLQTDGLLHTTGISAPIGQSHDPIDWPN